MDSSSNTPDKAWVVEFFMHWHKPEYQEWRPYHPFSEGLLLTLEMAIQWYQRKVMLIESDDLSHRIYNVYTKEAIPGDAIR